MTRVRMLSGSRWSQRAGQVDSAVSDDCGRSLLLVPNHAAAQARTERLLRAGLSGIWGRPVQTFEGFARALLESVGRRIHLLDQVERRLLFEQVVLKMDAEGRLMSIGAAAQTGGFVTHMLRVVVQLKQAAVEPAVFRRDIQRRTGASEIDTVVASLYEAYQDELLRRGLHDRVGLFWEAAELCREMCPPILELLDLLALDGFDDFTPSEFRLLDAVARHVDDVLFGLAYNPDAPSQRDLYALPEATAAAVRLHFGIDDERHFEDPQPGTASQYGAQQVFWRDKPPSADGLRPNIRFTPRLDPVHEIESAGRLIKRLIVEEGVAPDDIAVVHARLRDVSEDLRQAFSEFGVPVRVGEERRAASSAVGRFVLSLFDAFAEWAREPVLDILSSPWFRTPGQPATHILAAWRPLAHAAKVVAGRNEWIDRITDLCKRLEDASTQDGAGGEAMTALKERLPGAAEAAKALLSALNALAIIEDEMPCEAPLTAFAEALERVLDEMGTSSIFSQTPGEGPAPEVLAAELEAYRAIRGVLARMKVLGRPSGGGEAPRLERGRLVRVLRALFAESIYRLPSPRAAVQVLSPDRVRQLEFGHVFLLGANDGAMPGAPGINAVYGDDEIRALAEMGVRLDDKEKHARTQRLLFHHVLAAARDKLWISWHTADRSDRLAMPSPFVNELMELFPGGEMVAPSPAAHDFLPLPEEAASSRDLTNASFTCGWDAPDEAHANWFAALRARAAIETERQSPQFFGKYDGVLSIQDLILEIAARFGADHDFSAQQLEEYAQCPFRFFAQRVLGLRDEPVPSLEFDPRLRGTIMHRILERFHRRYLGRPLAEIGIREAGDAMKAILEEVLDAYARQVATVPLGVLVAEKEQLRRRLERYMYVERASDTGWAPIHLETSFGSIRKPSAYPPSTREPFRLDTDGGTIRLVGRIDRIDGHVPLEEGGPLRIIDYKTSKHGSRKELITGQLLQLGLYALALEQHIMSGGVCEEANYVPVGYAFGDWTEALGGSNETERSKRRGALLESVSRCVRGMRVGYFPPEPAEQACRHCAFKLACRYEEARAARKTRAAETRDMQ